MVEDGDAFGEQLAASSRPVAGDQEQLVPPDPESAVDEPAQIVLVPDATAVGIGFTVTGCEPCPWQAPAVTVTVYVVVTEGDGEIVCVVAPPGLHR